MMIMSKLPDNHNIIFYCNDFESVVSKSCSGFDDLKAYLKQYPDLFSRQAYRHWLKETQEHAASIPENNVLLISVTPAGTSYSVIPRQVINA